ncbi:FecR domain-containing protein [Rapidithrix thailandica]|uniref:FecR domain-containing protein n=1 Tax=Rapidithrix thailandica TaxID=413964 RepID=A0AAW9SFE1_9BACT
MNHKRFTELATKYLSGELSTEEIGELDMYLANEEYRRQFQTISSQWNIAKRNFTQHEFDIQKGKAKLYAKIRRHDASFGAKKKTIHLNPLFWKVAASVLVLLTLAWWVWQQPAPTAPGIVWKEISTQPGQKTILSLGDGTQITLNAGSVLRYPESFQDSIRWVHLMGEAFFDVASNPDKPFIVRSGRLDTRVLGTKFNVKSYEEEEIARVSLVEGKVEVTTPSNKKVVLNPKQEILYQKDRQDITVKEFTPLKVVGWKENTFIMENEPLKNLLPLLERNFGVEIQLTDTQLANCKITADFRGESVWTMLEVLKYTTGIEYDFLNDKTIVLNGNGCN